MPQRILAVELAGDRVRAAAADRTWNALEFIAAYESERASDETDLSGALRRLVAQTGQPDIVVSALPTDKVAKRLLELPFADARRLNQVVPFALEEHLPFPVDGAVVAFTRVGKQASVATVLAAFVRKADLQHHLELFRTAGLDPRTVTLAPFAVAALFSRARNGAAPVAHLVVETDQTSTSVVLIDSDGVPRAMRSVGGGLLTRDGKAQSANDAAPVLNALRQTMLAHVAEVEPEDVIVTGPGAAQLNVRHLLTDALAIKTREASDFDCSAMFEGRQPDTTRFSTPVAMLLGELPGHPIELPNFRQAEYAFKGRTRGDWRPFRWTFVFAGGLAAMIALDFGLGVSMKLHRLHQIDDKIAELAAPAVGDSSDPMGDLRGGIASMRHRLHELGGNLASNAPLDVLLEISQAPLPRAAAQMQEVLIDGNGAKLTGQADSFATVDQVKKVLELTGEFGPIEVTHAKTGDDNKVDFLLSAQFKDSVGGAK